MRKNNLYQKIAVIASLSVLVGQLVSVPLSGFLKNASADINATKTSELDQKLDKSVQTVDSDATLEKNGNSITAQNDGHSVEMNADNLTMKIIAQDGTNTELTMRMRDINEVQSTTEKNKTLYENVLEGVDILKTNLETGVKEDIIVKNSEVPTTLYYELETKNLTPKITSEQVVFSDNDGQEKMVFPAPFVYDKYGVRNQNAVYELLEVNDFAEFKPEVPHVCGIYFTTPDTDTWTRGSFLPEAKDAENCLDLIKEKYLEQEYCGQQNASAVDIVYIPVEDFTAKMPEIAAEDFLLSAECNMPKTETTEENISTEETTEETTEAPAEETTEETTEAPADEITNTETPTEENPAPEAPEENVPETAEAEENLEATTAIADTEQPEPTEEIAENKTTEETNPEEATETATPEAPEENVSTEETTEPEEETSEQDIPAEETKIPAEEKITEENPTPEAPADEITEEETTKTPTPETQTPAEFNPDDLPKTLSTKTADQITKIKTEQEELWANTNTENQEYKKYILTLSWNAEGLAYPIVIDPSVIFQTTTLPADENIYEQTRKVGIMSGLSANMNFENFGIMGEVAPYEGKSADYLADNGAIYTYAKYKNDNTLSVGENLSGESKLVFDYIPPSVRSAVFGDDGAGNEFIIINFSESILDAGNPNHPESKLIANSPASNYFKILDNTNNEIVGALGNSTIDTNTIANDNSVRVKLDPAHTINTGTSYVIAKENAFADTSVAKNLSAFSTLATSYSRSLGVYGTPNITNLKMFPTTIGIDEIANGSLISLADTGNDGIISLDWTDITNYPLGLEVYFAINENPEVGYITESTLDEATKLTDNTKLENITLPEGIRYIHIRAKVGYNGFGSEGVFKITYDSIPPDPSLRDIENNAIPDGSGKYYDFIDNGETKITLNTPDYDTDECRISTTNQAFSAMSAGACTDPTDKNISTCTINALTEGNYTYYYACDDNTDKESLTKQVDFEVNYSYPAIVSLDKLKNISTSETYIADPKSGIYNETTGKYMIDTGSSVPAEYTDSSADGESLTCKYTTDADDTYTNYTSPVFTGGTLSLEGKSTGDYTVHIRCRDDGANAESLLPFTFYYHVDAPANTGKKSPTCSSEYTEYCYTEEECNKINGQWYGGSCHKPTCNTYYPSACENEKDCSALGIDYIWEDMQCKKIELKPAAPEVNTPKSCSTTYPELCSTPTECSSLGSNYEYTDGVCKEIKNISCIGIDCHTECTGADCVSTCTGTDCPQPPTCIGADCAQSCEGADCIISCIGEDCTKVGCDTSHPQFCTNTGDCLSAGLSWNNNICEIPTCDTNHLLLCETQTECENISMIWKDNTCTRPPEDTTKACSTEYPTSCTTPDTCTGANLYWYNESCHTNPENPNPTCSTQYPTNCTTPETCETQNLYWYEENCHTNPEQGTTPELCSTTTPQFCTNLPECELFGGVWNNDGNNCEKANPICSPENLSACGNVDCMSIGGGYWYNSTCNPTPSSTPICSPDYLESCNILDCSILGNGYWYNNTCNKNPEQDSPDNTCNPTHRDLCETETECSIDGFGVWIDETCQAPAGECTSANLENCNKINCMLVGGGYWYEDACHVTPVCSANSPEYCDNPETCTSLGDGYVWNGESCSTFCSTNTLNSCTNEPSCSALGAEYLWTGLTCIEVGTCSQFNLMACSTEDTCSSLGTNYIWENNICKEITSQPNVCLAGNINGCETQETCKSNGGYWYENTCYEEVINKDTDGDGLSDALEVKIGTDPTKIDTDGDGFPDNEEYLDYGTDPLDPASYPGSTGQLVEITNWQEGQTSSGTGMSFRGIAPADSTVSIIAIRGAKTYILTTVRADLEGKFLGMSDTDLSDGEYILIATATGDNEKILGESDTLRVIIDNSLASALGSPIIETFDKVVFTEQPAENTIEVSIDILNNQPVLKGSTLYGSQITASWHSIIKSSSVIVDSEIGRFSLKPSEPLAMGNHEVILYAEKDGVRSQAIRLKFYIGIAGLSVFNPAKWQFWLLLLIIVMATYTTYHYRERIQAYAGNNPHLKNMYSSLNKVQNNLKKSQKHKSNIDNDDDLIV